MRIIWTLIALAAVAALCIIYRSNRPVDERPMNVTANCQDSYPPVVTTIPASANSDAKVKVSCKPDRFIGTDVPERSL